MLLLLFFHSLHASTMFTISRRQREVGEDCGVWSTEKDTLTYAIREKFDYCFIDLTRIDGDLTVTKIGITRTRKKSFVKKLCKLKNETVQCSCEGDRCNTKNELEIGTKLDFTTLKDNDPQTIAAILQEISETLAQRFSPGLRCLVGSPPNGRLESTSSRHCTVKFNFEANTKKCDIIEYSHRNAPVENSGEVKNSHSCTMEENSAVCHCTKSNCNWEMGEIHSFLSWQSTVVSELGDISACLASFHPQCASWNPDSESMVFENRKDNEYCVTKLSKENIIHMGRESFEVQGGSKVKVKWLKMCKLSNDSITCYCKSHQCNGKYVLKNTKLYDEEWIETTDTKVAEPYDQVLTRQIKECGSARIWTFDPADRLQCSETPEPKFVPKSNRAPQITKIGAGFSFMMLAARIR